MSESLKKNDRPMPMSHKLEERFGLDYVKKTWQKHGMYKAADLLSDEIQEYVSGNVIRAMVVKHGWKRVINDLSLPIARGVVLGNTDPSYFRYVTISGYSNEERQTEEL